MSKVLLLFSLLLMPLGMGPVAASAPSGDHHSMTAGTAIEHCPERPSKHEQGNGQSLCAMACASALPAQDIAHDDAFLLDHQLISPVVALKLHSIDPDIVVPPPKAA